MTDSPLYVTRPFLPPLSELTPYLDSIWASRRLANDGPFHAELESALCTHLGVSHLTLFSNGTLALMTALQAARLTGEVLTSPFTFIATVNALYWNRLRPVFVDIDPVTLGINPALIEAAITPETSAILPVHVYGKPCDTDAIREIAALHNLKVIYDAAHTFGVKHQGRALASFGDMSALSFHATKVFNTFEGGAVVSRTAELKARVDRLRNFGFKDATTEAIIEPGLNGKMDEFRAAVGLVQLKHMDWVMVQRERVRAAYAVMLPSNVTLVDSPNNSYLPVLFKQGEMYRNRAQAKLAEAGIYCRRYFGLVSGFPPYRNLPSANFNNLLVARAVVQRVLCLPMYPELSDEDVERVCGELKKVVN